MIYKSKLVSARHLVLSLALLGLLSHEAPAAVKAARPLAVPSTARTLDDRWIGGRPLRVLALRVEFREDSVTGTTGNGLMESAFDTSLVLDPLPHDSLYFADHLKFLRTYYETVSKGHIVFADTIPVFPAGDSSHAAYRLDYPMWHYNHNTSEQDLNRGLVSLFVDAVRKAAQQDPSLNFNLYDAVIVFHAGTGKDFNLGFDNTPFDIPSAYINETDLAGQTVPSGVVRGLILPEGENQQEALDLGIELSMNGIMVKLFGNWLGLPDLFNTQTGTSGIGRWGMMDQGSGNVNALVPALPDAWSRVYMGWEHPLEVVPSGSGDTLHVARFGSSDTLQVVKLPVTPREYYLIENRAADLDSPFTAIPDTGAYVELLDRGNRRLQVYRDGRMAIEPGFRVAVRVRDNRYDFGIPGNGVLIWHVDEDVIAQGLSTNSVNTNRDHRGVDLVEADGAQDIGQEYGFASAGSGTELGVPEDAWYSSNNFHRDANGNSLTVRFADGTFPSDRLYDGSLPHLDVSHFTDVAPVMSFVVRSTKVVPGFPVALTAPADWVTADLNGDGRPEIYFASNDSLIKADSVGHLSFVAHLLTGMHLSRYSLPASVGDGFRDQLLFEGRRVGLVRNVNGVDTLLLLPPLEYNDVHLYPAMVDGSEAYVPRVLAVAADTNQMIGTLYTALYDGDLNRLVSWQSAVHGTGLSTVPFNLKPFPSPGFVLMANDSAVCLSVRDSSFAWPWTKGDQRIQPQAIVVNVHGDSSYVYLKGFGYVSAASGATLCEEPQCVAPQVDWNGDGIPDGGGRFGRHELEREDAPHIAADTSWVMDVDCSGDPDLIGLADRQVADSTLPATSIVHTRVAAVSHNGSAFPGFPYALPVADSRRPFTWTRDQALHLVSTTHANGKYYYSVVRLAEAGRRTRFNYTDDVSIINVGQLRPQVNSRAEWVYCWPNPTSDVSRIRITLPYAADADVRIFDLAGRKVAELHGGSSAPGPLAFEVPWNVSGVESGVYIGRVIVHGNGGSQESQIKIAVVK